ncbi:MAG: acetyl-CoA carboxylase, carboxyltransferase subunit beta [Candidatus Margulisiibacteriota bacterium]
MSISDWFAKREKTNEASEKLNIPGNLWIKCDGCSEVLYTKDLEENAKTCPKCNHHFRISPDERIAAIFDPDSFTEVASHIRPVDFLLFEDTEPYSVRIKKAQKKTNRNDAVIIGQAALKKRPVNVGVMDFGYMGGSMGSVVGEKLTQLIEMGVENQNPVIIFTSSGGARMQESILSLMQMAKTSGALYKLGQARVPYISVLCDPTTGGTSASFAMLGDINLAEPGALISFAGPRVIEQTIRQKLPDGFQRSEFLLEHGMVDRVVHRKELRQTLYTLISILDPRESGTKDL